MSIDAEAQVIESSSSPQSINQTILQTEAPKPKNRDIKTKLLVVLVAILAILLSCSIYIILSKNYLSDTKPKSENGLTTSDIAKEPIETNREPIETNVEELFYQQNGELYFLGKTGDSKQVTNTNQGIYTFDQASDDSIVAFISGEKTTNPNNYTYVIPNSVYVYFADKGKTQKIYELVPKNFPNSEYSITIKDVRVSDDGTKIAVTTSDSLLVYNVLSEKLETVFALPVADPLRPANIFSYGDPMFSPNNTKIVFRKNHYEGFSYGFVDLDTKEIKDLKYQGYSSGQMILGWLDDSSLIIKDYKLGEPGKSITRIKIAKLLVPEESSTIYEIDGLIDTAFLTSDKIYAVVSHQKANYDIYPETKTPYYENYFSIYEFDLQAKTKKELSTIKQDFIKKDAISKSYGNLKLSSDSKKLYISGQIGINSNPPYAPAYTPVIMALDLSTSVEPVEIVQDASF